MTKKGGKLNQGMRDWLDFVDKVKLEEKIDHREAIMRAKERKDAGEEWRTSGGKKEVVSKEPEVETKSDNKAKEEAEHVTEAKVESTSAGESDEVIPPSNQESAKELPNEELTNGGKKGGKKTSKKQKGGKKTNKKQKGGKKSNKSKKKH
jgi:hypothetical protein